MNRALLSVGRQFLQRRALHKGVDSTPPLRFTSMPEKFALYAFIAVTFLAYPTSVMLRLDSLRPKGDNALNPDVQEQIDAIRASRRS